MAKKNNGLMFGLLALGGILIVKAVAGAKPDAPPAGSGEQPVDTGSGSTVPTRNPPAQQVRQPGRAAMLWDAVKKGASLVFTAQTVCQVGFIDRFGAFQVQRPITFKSGATIPGKAVVNYSKVNIFFKYNNLTIQAPADFLTAK